jgi:hypothetical protein
MFIHLGFLYLFLVSEKKLDVLKDSIHKRVERRNFKKNYLPNKTQQGMVHLTLKLFKYSWQAQTCG